VSSSETFTALHPFCLEQLLLPHRRIHQVNKLCMLKLDICILQWKNLRRHQLMIRLMMTMMRISAAEAGADPDQLLGQDPDSQVEEHQR